MPENYREEIGQEEIRIRSGFKGITPHEFFMMLAHKRLENEEMEEKSKGNGSSGGGKPNNMKNPAF